MDHHINCAEIHSRVEFHRILSQTLHFPEWYGNNLDALYDCMAEITATIRLRHWDMAEAALGSYGKNTRRVLTHAAQRNGPLEIIFE